jgi:subtilisin family serine protease
MKVTTILLVILALASCHRAEAKKCGKAPIKIAIIDTGFGYKDEGHDAHLCQYGHKDFSNEKNFTKNYVTHDPIPVDVHGHGTNIAGIIGQYANDAGINYCIVVIKFYSEKQTGAQNLLSTIRAFNYAANIKSDYVNYSGGGNFSNKIEHAAIKRYLDHGGHFVAAAGNEGRELRHERPELDEQFDDGKTEAYFPAMYDPRIIVVGNLCENGVEYRKQDGTTVQRCPSSNYGSLVSRWEVGENITAYGITMTGTSQATAVATGKIVAESTNKCDIGF